MCGGYAAAAPVASFTTNVTHGIAPLSVQFNDTSTGRILSWSWNFGNGVTSTLQNPTYIYTLAGKYTVVETVDGVRSQRCCEIIITVLPTYKNIKQSFANRTAPEPPGSLASIYASIQASKYNEYNHTYPYVIPILSSTKAGKYVEGSNITINATTINATYKQLQTNSSSLSALLNNNITAWLNAIKPYISDIYSIAQYLHLLFHPTHGPVGQRIEMEGPGNPIQSTYNDVYWDMYNNSITKQSKRFQLYNYTH